MRDIKIYGRMLIPIKTRASIAGTGFYNRKIPENTLVVIDNPK